MGQMSVAVALLIISKFGAVTFAFPSPLSSVIPPLTAQINWGGQS
jgi:hypothetical protein